MADRVDEPSAAARRIVHMTAGEPTMQRIYDARSRLKKQPKIPDEARSLIKEWRDLAYDVAEKLNVAEKLLRERESTQAHSRRQQAEARSRSDSRSTRGFFGFFLGVLVTVAILVVAAKLGIASLVLPPTPR